MVQFVFNEQKETEREVNFYCSEDRKMFLLSLQLTAKLGNDGRWKVTGNDFTPFIYTYLGHSQSVIYRGGQCVASTHA